MVAPKYDINNKSSFSGADDTSYKLFGSMAYIYIMPPIPPIPPPAAAGVSSLISVTTASAVERRDATPLASVSAVLTT